MLIALVLLIACATIFFKAADIENLDHPVAWAGGSIMMFVAGTYLTPWGWIGGLLSQVVFFIWMGVWLVIIKKR